MLVFENLPNEVHLLIHRYLSCADILYSFYGLNIRLNRLIKRFRTNVVLCQIEYKQLNSICQSILPLIGTDIFNLVISNDWKGVLSKVFLNYFSNKIELVFPNLRKLILPTFRMTSLMLLVDHLKNFKQLNEIKIMSLYETSQETIQIEDLFEKILSIHVKSLIFDDDTLALSFQNAKSIIYSHIEHLVIELKTIDDLHRLLTSFSQVKSLDVSIVEPQPQTIEETIQFESNLSIKSFRLRSFLYLWNVETLSLILKRMPNLDELFIEICTNNDTRLLDGTQMSSLFSLFTLKTLNYSIQFDYFEETNSTEAFRSTWNDVLWIENETKTTILLTNLPIRSQHLYLPYSIAIDSNYLRNYSNQVRFLTLYENSCRLAEIFPILNQCYQLERLVLRINEEISPRTIEKIQLRRLSSLIFLVSLEKSLMNLDDFKYLLEMSPNLYHLAVNFELFKSFVDAESLSDLLKQRITHVLIATSLTTTMETIVESIEKFSIILPKLRHLYFHLESTDYLIKPLIQSVLTCLPHWKDLISFGVTNTQLEDLTTSEQIRQWIIDNSHLTDEHLFHVDYSDMTFRLWL